MTGSVQFALDKRAIVQWNFIYILETWNPRSLCKQDSCNCEQDNMSFPSTDKQETVTNPTFLQRAFFVLFGFVLSGWTLSFFEQGPPISALWPLDTTVAHEVTHSPGGAAEREACWRRVALLNILSACSHESPGFLRCSGRNVMPIVKRAHLPRSVNPTWTWASRALGCVTNKCKPRFHLYGNPSIKIRFPFENYTNHTSRRQGDFSLLFFLVLLCCLWSPELTTNAVVRKSNLR